MLGIRLNDPVERLIGAPVATIRPTATLRDAAHALAADGVGLLVVVDPQAVRGVLSERDLVNAIAEEVDLDEARVRDHATTDLVRVEESATIAEAAEAMAAAQVRHIAVTRAGTMTGVVSMRDVINVLLEDLHAGSN